MKILATAPTFAPSIDGPTFIEANEVVDVETDTAKALVVAGKGLYVDGKDDPTKFKVYTASDKQLDAAKAARAEATKAAKAAKAE